MTYLSVALGYYDAALITTLQPDSQPLIVCGLLARALPASTALAPVRQRIANHLQSTITDEWLQRAPLAEVCAVVDGLQACKNGPSAAETVALVQRLLAAETEIGGPYADPGQSADMLTNSCVAQCLSWLAQPLPRVEAFLLAQAPELSAVETADRPVYAALLLSNRAQPTNAARQIASAQTVFCAAYGAGIVADLLDGQPATGNQQPAILRQSSEMIYTTCRQKIHELSGPLLDHTGAMLESIIRCDRDGMGYEISLLPWFYGSALPPGSADRSRPSQLQIDAGVANIFAWMAYSIYDDFLDDEGQPVMLGTANYSFRTMLDCYRQLLPDRLDFWQFVQDALTTVERANCLETSYFRFQTSKNHITIGDLPDFGDCSLLADRALSHVLGPMATLADSGVSPTSTAWLSTWQAWRHYLIARQLNDDIHDWRQDFQSGHATYVVVCLLRHLSTPPGIYRKAELLPLAQTQFWRHVLPAICDMGLEHVAQARRGFAAGPALLAGNHLDQLITYTHDALVAAKHQHDRAQLLVQSFRRSGTRI